MPTTVSSPSGLDKQRTTRTKGRSSERQNSPTRQVVTNATVEAESNMLRVHCLVLFTETVTFAPPVCSRIWCLNLSRDYCSVVALLPHISGTSCTSMKMWVCSRWRSNKMACSSPSDVKILWDFYIRCIITYTLFLLELLSAKMNVWHQESFSE